MTKTCIIDYGIGNIASIYNGIHSTGNDVIVSSDSEKISNSTHLILPGVGSFQKGMEGIESKGLIKILNDQVLLEKKPILGICLGMQLFASYGLEDGYCKGLDWIKGKVENKSKLLINVEETLIFYFVHSYHFVPEDKSVITGVCKHGKDLISCIEYKNIYATQFHPEKSHNIGLQVLNNFINNT